MMDMHGLNAAAYRDDNAGEGRRPLESFGIANIHVHRAKIWHKGHLLVESPVWLAGDISSRGMIGAYTFLRDNVRISGQTAHIGRYCSIAPGAVIGDSNHPTDWLSTHSFQWGDGQWIPSEAMRQFTSPPKQVPQRTIVGSDVWIGANAIILPGVNVGDGAIIAAGSVVSRDVPPYAIVGGIPARIIRHRFDEETIARLMRVRWWRFRLDDLFDIPFNDIQLALAELEKRLAAGALRELEPKLYAVAKKEITEFDDPKALRLFRKRLHGAETKAKTPAAVKPNAEPQRETVGAVSPFARLKPFLPWITAFIAGIVGSAAWEIAFG